VQTNTGSLPLLAGPVDLLGEGGFIGRTQVSIAAPNERFALGWGPEAALRVQREVDQVDQVDQESGLTENMLSSRRAVTLRLSNIGADELMIKVTERVPVSEIEQVEIAVDQQETTEGKTPDENGIVIWDVRLAPFGPPESAPRLHRKEAQGCDGDLTRCASTACTAVMKTVHLTEVQRDQWRPPNVSTWKYRESCYTGTRHYRASRIASSASTHIDNLTWARPYDATFFAMARLPVRSDSFRIPGSLAGSLWRCVRSCYSRDPAPRTTHLHQRPIFSTNQGVLTAVPSVTTMCDIYEAVVLILGCLPDGH